MCGTPLVIPQRTGGEACEAALHITACKPILPGTAWRLTVLRSHADTPGETRKRETHGAEHYLDTTIGHFVNVGTGGRFL